jgi:hypothetical protein
MMWLILKNRNERVDLFIGYWADIIKWLVGASCWIFGFTVGD